DDLAQAALFLRRDMAVGVRHMDEQGRRRDPIIVGIEAALRGATGQFVEKAFEPAEHDRLMVLRIG
ncbi:MAG TPA: hypothetical protein P5256_15965, partial [Beijerinckiaceae bacterium]|nr:hypothetical protein [Beijerinckiaceae bacterium]